MTNSKRKCAFCGKRSKPESGFIRGIQFFCDKDHYIEYAGANVKKLASKQRVKEVKAERSVLRERKEAIKPASKFLSEAQTAFNKYIRLRDYHEPCPSCNKPREQIEAEQGWKTGGCWDAGHYMTRGAKGQLRFVLFNVHKQCKSCNGGSDKFSAKAATVGATYRVNLIKKIGLEKVEWLENNNDIDLRKKDIEYLKRIKRVFSKKARIQLKRITPN